MAASYWPPYLYRTFLLATVHPPSTCLLATIHVSPFVLATIYLYRTFLLTAKPPSTFLLAKILLSFSYWPLHIHIIFLLATIPSSCPASNGHAPQLAWAKASQPSGETPANRWREIYSGYRRVDMIGCNKIDSGINIGVFRKRKPASPKNSMRMPRGLRKISLPHMKALEPVTPANNIAPNNPDDIKAVL